MTKLTTIFFSFENEGDGLLFEFDFNVSKRVRMFEWEEKIRNN